MGRGRGKRRKQPTISAQDDPRSEEEKIPTLKRRGRPQKLLKDETEEDEVMENNDENARNLNTSRTSMDSITSENETKGRKRFIPVEENSGLIKEEEDDHSGGKPVGFRQNGSRRKSKPRRAAEVGVEC